MRLQWAATELEHLLVYPRTNPFCGEMKGRAQKSSPCGTQVCTGFKQHVRLSGQRDTIIVLYSPPCFAYLAFSTPPGLSGCYSNRRPCTP